MDSVFIYTCFSEPYSVQPDSTQSISGELSRSSYMFSFEVDIANGVNRFSVGTVCPTNFDTKLEVINELGNMIKSNDDHGNKDLLDVNNCPFSVGLSSIKYLNVTAGRKYTVKLSLPRLLTSNKKLEFKLLIIGSFIGIVIIFICF